MPCGSGTSADVAVTEPDVESAVDTKAATTIAEREPQYIEKLCTVNEGSISTRPIDGPPAVCQGNAETGDFDSWNVT